MLSQRRLIQIVIIMYLFVLLEIIRTRKMNQNLYISMYIYIKGTFTWVAQSAKLPEMFIFFSSH